MSSPVSASETISYGKQIGLGIFLSVVIIVIMSLIASGIIPYDEKNVFIFNIALNVFFIIYIFSNFFNSFVPIVFLLFIELILLINLGFMINLFRFTNM